MPILKKLSPAMQYFCRLYTNPNNKDTFSNALRSWKKAFPLRWENHIRTYKSKADVVATMSVSEFMRHKLIQDEIKRIMTDEKNIIPEYSFQGVQQMLSNHLASDDPREQLKAKEVMLTHMAKIADLQLKHGYMKEEDITKDMTIDELLSRYKELASELAPTLLEGNTDSQILLSDNNNTLTQSLPDVNKLTPALPDTDDLPDTNTPPSQLVKF